MTATSDGCARSTRADILARAGERAAAEMLRLWKLDIIDPPIGSKHPRAADSLAEINRIIVRNGWGKPGAYKGNGSPQWCGMTAGDVWATAGLDSSMLAVWFASTDRLVAWATYQPFNGHANPRPAGDDLRLCGALVPGKPLPFEPRAGDIVIVGDGKRAAGNHVTIGMSYDPARRAFNTVSGNGGGLGPDGKSREGISQREYFVDRGYYRVMFAIRPALRDLLPSIPPLVVH